MRALKSKQKRYVPDKILGDKIMCLSVVRLGENGLFILAFHSLSVLHSCIYLFIFTRLEGSEWVGVRKEGRKGGLKVLEDSRKLVGWTS